MPRIGFASVRKSGENVFYIEGADGEQDGGTVTVWPAGDGGHPWTLDPPEVGKDFDLSFMPEGEMPVKGSYRCTVQPVEGNGQRGTFERN